MRAVTCVVALAALLPWAAGLYAGPATPAAAAKFLSRKDPAPSSYRAIRRLTAANHKRRMAGWIEAVTELDPVSGFQYSITAEGGSAYIRNNVLKRILAAEQAAHRNAESERAALTAENYTFGEAREEADGFLLVPIVPKRRTEMLVDGIMVLDADADLVRVEGRLSKNPSFWTRGVDVVRRYERPNGIRMAVEMSSTAHVLIVGPSTFSMCIDYEAINGASVDARTSCS